LKLAAIYADDEHVCFWGQSGHPSIPSSCSRTCLGHRPTENERAPAETWRPASDITNGKREHRCATSNDEDLGPSPFPNSRRAMHGRRRIRGVRKHNEQFQRVKSYAREVADCSLRSALRIRLPGRRAGQQDGYTS